MSNNMKKLNALAKIEGMTVDQLMTLDSVVKGICMNPECNYTTDVEPDQTGGYCEHCGTQTVTSCLILLDVI
jgi:hypothetical protein